MSFTTTAQAIASFLGADLQGRGDTVIHRLASLQSATQGDVTFLAQSRWRKQLQNTEASAVILAPSERDTPCTAEVRIWVENPYLAYARLSRWWEQQTRPAFQSGIHPSAVVHPTADIHPSAEIGPLCHVGSHARIGADAQLASHVVIESHAYIGDEVQLKARVVVGAGCQIGPRSIIQPGAVIGADGFGFAPNALGAWEKIAQLGCVMIGSDVEIGANTCIDRGAIGNTVIGDGVKLDNLIQIGHNTQVGAHTVMAGCVGVAGSAKIGAHCMIGGGANILGHLEIVDHVTISALTTVSRSILQPGQYSGMFPFQEHAAWEKNAAAVRHLYDIRQRLRALESQLKGH